MRTRNHKYTYTQARRLDRRQKLLFEAESSARRNAAIAMKWASLFEKEIPLDLLNDMEAQREACMKVISQKDELIRVISVFVFVLWYVCDLAFGHVFFYVVCVFVFQCPVCVDEVWLKKVYVKWTAICM
jgi:hypothetical protein